MDWMAWGVWHKTCFFDGAVGIRMGTAWATAFSRNSGIRPGQACNNGVYTYLKTQYLGPCYCIDEECALDKSWISFHHEPLYFLPPTLINSSLTFRLFVLSSSTSLIFTTTFSNNSTLTVLLPLVSST